LEASDALELLSPVFQNIELRRYAVSRLSHAKPEQILLYLPQLVQALKYERFAQNVLKEVKEQEEFQKRKEDAKEGSIKAASEKTTTGSDYDAQSQQILEQAIQKCLTGDDLASFLIRSACNDATTTYYLYWYLKVEVCG
uniref:PIK helical domain-containing protein n=1 Tax=Gongylonema pulchrum TaxID=637853 RepID=A0A183D814_9BILA